MKKVVIILICMILTSCARKENSIPSYSGIINESMEEVISEYNKVVSIAKEYEINILIDYCISGKKVLDNEFSLIEIGSDIDGSETTLRSDIKGLGEYKNEKIEKLLNMSYEEAKVIISDSMSSIENLKSFKSAMLITSNICVCYTYDKDNKLLDQIIEIYSKDGSSDIVIVTWNEEGYIGVKYS